MNTKQHLGFWILVIVALTLLFSTSLNGIVISFYFVCFLLPVVIGTSYFFNAFLVPRFLLKGYRWKFGLHFTYLLVVSIYLEMLVMILTFIILADYQIANLGKIVSDIYLMAIVLYLVVFANGFVNVARSLRIKQAKISELEEDRKKNQNEYLLIRIDRKNAQIKIDEILFIESFSDYIKIHTLDQVHITKEKISAVEKLLPTLFIRIHRSFIVNRDYIKSFNRETIEIESTKLPIGRKYKKVVSEVLST